MKSFAIVIPSFNNREWLRRNLDSVLRQKYNNFRVIYIDDYSTDGTGDLVAAYLEENDSQKRVSFFRNEERLYSMQNIYRAVHSCHPEEIIVLVDGDDWLIHDGVLQTLNTVYSDPEVWLTYGQYRQFPIPGSHESRELLPEIIQDNAYRDYPWVTSHLRTFYAGLFHKIKKEDLLVEGKFFSFAADLAFMFPLLEMASIHSRFIPEVLYVYNVATPLNEFKLDRELQMSYEKEIRGRNRYLRLATF